MLAGGALPTAPDTTHPVSPLACRGRPETAGGARRWPRRGPGPRRPAGGS